MPKIRHGKLYRKDWVVYCKPPFADASRVVAYLGRYTHRVAISNARILRLGGMMKLIPILQRKMTEPSRIDYHLIRERVDFRNGCYLSATRANYSTNDRAGSGQRSKPVH